MPTSLTCDLCGEEQAASMLTNLANGDTLAVGQACQLTFHLTVATELIKAMPAELAAAYNDQLAGLAAVSRYLADMTPEDQSRAAAREQYGDLCPECGIAWDQPSPGCPHKIWNLHPLPPAEGTPDDNGTPRPAGPAGDTATAEDHAGAADR